MQSQPGNHQANVVQGQQKDVTTAVEIQEISRLNREEIEKLRSFLTTIDKPVGSCSMAQSGKYSTNCPLNGSSTVSNGIWVVDSGATDHMTNSSHNLSTYTPCPGNKKIKTVDGTLISIAGKGTVKPTPTMTLHSVLHVPKLSVSLLSIKQVTSQLNCKVTFYPTYCHFQDLKTGKMIGHAKEEDGVYYLDTNSGGLRSSFLSKAYLSLTHYANKAQIWLHHV